MKKILLSALSFVLVAALAIGGTIAYFTGKDSKTNTFTVGNVKISLAEPNWDRADQSRDIIPGAHFVKDPTITNDGKNDAYLRVRITLTNAAELAQAFPSFEAALDNQSVIEGYDAANWDIVSNVLNSQKDTRTITLYYKANSGIFAAGTSVTLFTGIKIPTVLNHELDALSALDAETHPTSLTVSADAIQAFGFDSVTDAFAAFDNQALV